MVKTTHLFLPFSKSKRRPDCFSAVHHLNIHELLLRSNVWQVTHSICKEFLQSKKVLGGGGGGGGGCGGLRAPPWNSHIHMPAGVNVSVAGLCAHTCHREYLFVSVCVCVCLLVCVWLLMWVITPSFLPPRVRAAAEDRRGGSGWIKWWGSGGWGCRGGDGKKGRAVCVCVCVRR